MLGSCSMAGSPVHSVRMEATFATTVECLLALGREFDLASSWNKYLLDSVILSQPSMFEATLYACNWLPFPFSSCDCIVHAKGYDLAEVGVWGISSSSSSVIYH